MFEKFIRWLAKPFVKDLVKEEEEEWTVEEIIFSPIPKRSEQKSLLPPSEMRGYYYECYRPLKRG